LRALQRQTGMALRSVSVQVNLLVSLGLLRDRTVGRHRYVRAETQHPAFQPLADLVRVTAGIGDAIAGALEGHPGVRLALLFGSVAQGQATAESDVDLLVVGTLRLRELMALLTPVRDRLRREINPVLLTPKEFTSRRAKREHFLTGVLASKPTVLLGNLHDVT